MPSPFPDSRFDAAMRALTEMHAEAVLYRESIDAAERVFGQALRIGAAIRRAVRQGSAERPDAEDCIALEALAADLEAALGAVGRLPAVAALRASLEIGDSARAAHDALGVFAGLERAEPPPAFGYRAVALRQRARGGETLRAPEELAAALARRVAAGISDAPAPGSAGEPGAARSDVPEPVVLSPSLETCGSEIALRVDLQRAALPVLRHTATADLWIFSRDELRPVEVAVQRSADDEWWTASPIPYEDYVARLNHALTARGVAVAREGDQRGPG